MFEALRTAVEELELCPRGDELVAALTLVDRLNAKITSAFGEFDKAGGWAYTGAGSGVSWLEAHALMTARSANHLARNARRLSGLPVCADAYGDGSLSGGQIDAVVAGLDDDTASLFATHEAEVVPRLVPLNVRQVALAMRGWKIRAVASLPDPPEPKEPERSLHHSKTLGGRFETKGSFDPEGGSILDAAIRRASTDDAEGEPARSAAQRRADALVEIGRFFLSHSDQRVAGRHRPHLNVVVNAEDLVNNRGGQVVDGPGLDGATISKLACDSVLRRVVFSTNGEVLDYGTTTRSISSALWNALVVRDEHCRFPGCDRPSSWTEAHHVVWFSRGGRTALSNLVLVCSRHHHLLHLPGWGAILKEGAALEVTGPTGEVRITSPPRAGPTLWREPA